MVAHNETGVSLIEALITLAILSLSIAAVMELAGSTSNQIDTHVEQPRPYI